MWGGEQECHAQLGAKVCGTRSRHNFSSARRCVSRLKQTSSKQNSTCFRLLFPARLMLDYGGRVFHKPLSQTVPTYLNTWSQFAASKMRDVPLRQTRHRRARDLSLLQSSAISVTRRTHYCNFYSQWPQLHVVPRTSRATLRVSTKIADMNGNGIWPDVSWSRNMSNDASCAKLHPLAKLSIH